MKTTHNNLQLDKNLQPGKALQPGYKLSPALSTREGRTHPIVLIAATGLTIFSILGSAAITGLLPVNHQGADQDNATLSGVLSERATILPLPSPEISRAGIKADESRYDQIANPENPSNTKEFVKLRAAKPLVLG